MQLIDVYTVLNAPKILFDLLNEGRKKDIDWKAHCDYIEHNPYQEWYLIANDEDYIVGCVYLTHRHEVGVRIFKSEQDKGHGRFAVMALMNRHAGERLTANVNPNNTRALKLFASFGFKLTQVTLERVAPCESRVEK